MLVVQIVSTAGLVSPAYLPSLSSVLKELFEALRTHDFLVGVLTTLRTWFIAMVISIGITVPLGILLGLSEGVYRATRAVIELIRPLPAVALIPLLVLVAGTGLKMQLILVVFASMWPILLNTISAVHDVDVYMKDMALSFRIGRIGRVWRVICPSAAPLIATGIRLSSTVAILVAVTVELLVTTTGLGAFVGRAQTLGRATDLYAGVVMCGVLGMAINLVLISAERRLFGWAMQSEAEV